MISTLYLSQANNILSLVRLIVLEPHTPLKALPGIGSLYSTGLSDLIDALLSKSPDDRPDVHEALARLRVLDARCSWPEGESLEVDPVWEQHLREQQQLRANNNSNNSNAQESSSTATNANATATAAAAAAGLPASAYPTANNTTAAAAAAANQTNSNDANAGNKASINNKLGDTEYADDFEDYAQVNGPANATNGAAAAAARAAAAELYPDTAVYEGKALPGASNTTSALTTANGNVNAIAGGTTTVRSGDTIKVNAHGNPIAGASFEIAGAPVVSAGVAAVNVDDSAMWRTDAFPVQAVLGPNGTLIAERKPLAPGLITTTNTAANTTGATGTATETGHVMTITKTSKSGGVNNSFVADADNLLLRMASNNVDGSDGSHGNAHSFSHAGSGADPVGGMYHNNNGNGNSNPEDDDDDITAASIVIDRPIPAAITAHTATAATATLSGSAALDSAIAAAYPLLETFEPPQSQSQQPPRQHNAATAYDERPVGPRPGTSSGGRGGAEAPGAFSARARPPTANGSGSGGGSTSGVSTSATPRIAGDSSIHGGVVIGAPPQPTVVTNDTPLPVSPQPPAAAATAVTSSGSGSGIAGVSVSVANSTSGGAKPMQPRPPSQPSPFTSPNGNGNGGPGLLTPQPPPGSGPGSTGSGAGAGGRTHVRQRSWASVPVPAPAPVANNDDAAHGHSAHGLLGSGPSGSSSGAGSEYQNSNQATLHQHSQYPVQTAHTTTTTGASNANSSNNSGLSSPAPGPGLSTPGGLSTREAMLARKLAEADRRAAEMASAVRRAGGTDRAAVEARKREQLGGSGTGGLLGGGYNTYAHQQQQQQQQMQQHQMQLQQQQQYNNGYSNSR